MISYSKHISFHIQVAIVDLWAVMFFKTFGVYRKTEPHTELLPENKFTDVLHAAADGMGVNEHIRRKKSG